jgi:hypothetical protein
LRASGEAREGEKKRIRRGCWEEVEVDILGCCCWGWWSCCCEVGRVGFLDDECVWWRDVSVRSAICGCMRGRSERLRKCRVAREDIGRSQRASASCEMWIACWLPLVCYTVKSSTFEVFGMMLE